MHLHFKQNLKRVSRREVCVLFLAANFTELALVVFTIRL